MSTLAVILCLVGVILLQIFLSKRENRWAGLILPAISFLISFIYPLSMAAFTQIGSMRAELGGTTVFGLILVWLLANLPTAVLLAIYFTCRDKNRSVDKMNIQDL